MCGVELFPLGMDFSSGRKAKQIRDSTELMELRRLARLGTIVVDANPCVTRKAQT